MTAEQIMAMDLDSIIMKLMFAGFVITIYPNPNPQHQDEIVVRITNTLTNQVYENGTDVEECGIYLQETLGKESCVADVIRGLLILYQEIGL